MHITRYIKDWLMSNRVRSQRRKEENSSNSYTSLPISNVEVVDLKRNTAL
jgi:hypothetical protein